MELRNLFQTIFTRKPKQKDGSRWVSLTDNVSNWAPWGGDAYASDLVRASVDARARHIRKLEIVFHGSGKPSLQTKLKYAPNSWTTWSQFLYRLSVVLDMQCTAFIVPVYSPTFDVIGISLAVPQQFELVEVDGEPWVRMRFANGTIASDKLSNIGILTKFQYINDYFGTPNDALEDTLALIDIQRKGISQAAKNSTTYKLMAQLSNFSTSEDLVEERKRFTLNNFSSDADGGGFLLLPNTYTNIKELQQKTYSVDADQQKLIQTSIFNYFGVNENILNNSATPDQLDAFYEGAIEPFAVQLAEVMTRMLFTDTEQTYGNYIEFSADRLAYMTTQAKIQMIQQLADRGMITQNEARHILNLPALPYGDRTTIRGEYHLEDADGSMLASTEEYEDDGDEMDNSDDLSGIDDVSDLEDVEGDAEDEENYAEDGPDDSTDLLDSEDAEVDETESETEESDFEDDDDVTDLQDQMEAELDVLLDNMRELLDRANDGEFDDDDGTEDTGTD